MSETQVHLFPLKNIPAYPKNRNFHDPFLDESLRYLASACRNDLFFSSASSSAWWSDYWIKTSLSKQKGRNIRDTTNSESIWPCFIIGPFPMPCWNFVRRWLQGYQHETHWWLKSPKRPAFFCSAPWEVFRSSKDGAQELKISSGGQIFSRLYESFKKHLWREKFQIFFPKIKSHWKTKHIMFVDTLLEGFGTVFPDTVSTSIDLARKITWCFQLSAIHKVSRFFSQISKWIEVLKHHKDQLGA